jgi:hypothetical protein
MDDKPEEVRNADLAGVKLTPEKTWFFERGDGKIFATGEDEAHEILRNRTNWMRRDFKMLGVSDGKTYDRMIKENKLVSQSIRSEVEKLTIDLNKFLATFDRMKFDQLLSDTDDRIVKVKGLIKEIEDKIAVKEDEFTKLTKHSAQSAFDAELALARGHIEYPENKNVITPGKTGEDRKKILASMPR